MCMLNVHVGPNGDNYIYIWIKCELVLICLRQTAIMLLLNRCAAVIKLGSINVLEKLHPLTWSPLEQFDESTRRNGPFCRPASAAVVPSFRADTARWSGATPSHPPPPPPPGKLPASTATSDRTPNGFNKGRFLRAGSLLLEDVLCFI